MNQLNYKHPSGTCSVAYPPDLEPARRLIVLVSSLDADLIALTHRVWKLANVTGAHVRFLGLCSDAAQEPGLRRSLVTMSAIANYGNVSAESEAVVGRDWVDTVKSRCQAGDMVVCLAEQQTDWLQRPLSQILQSDLDVPVYIVSGLAAEKEPRSNWPIQMAAWIGFIAILLGFFILQVEISQLLTGWTIVLELLATAVEFWLIWVWNNLFK